MQTNCTRLELEGAPSKGDVFLDLAWRDRVGNAIEFQSENHMPWFRKEAAVRPERNGKERAHDSFVPSACAEGLRHQ